MQRSARSHLLLWNRLGHRPPISFLQTSRFWVSLSSSPHLPSICITVALSSCSF
ncbi:hypothetical protein DPMN_054630 [Dreissena polymorpha]|uniref:Uncharacterized protein n=1 Tax=Dreissena polymorpha TaxID=45954 RepID=A0A9D4CNG8_DREPO|nr:hypothetical protein DPMN_054630 [Dreissena polymorpha]